MEKNVKRIRKNKYKESVSVKVFELQKRWMKKKKLKKYKKKGCGKNVNEE